MKKIYKYFIIAFLLLTAKGFAQIGLPSKPEINMTFDHPFLDASNYSNGVPNNQNKGLYFPTTDLTKWTFKTDNLDGITFPTAFNGMMVYNIGSGYTMSDVSKAGKVVSVKPGFYYFQNLDNEEGTTVSNGSWKSIGSSGSSLMEVGPDPCTAVAADGTGCDNEFTVTDPDCPGGPFSIVVVGGSDYASIAEKDETVGSFRLSFLANNSINVRAVIVRVTSSCTGLYKDFLFTQLGQPCDSGLGTVPPITSTPSGKNISFCAGGAVYLSIPHTTPNLDQIIWTRNSVEVARGVNSITVTQAGVYDVFMGNIGCNNIAGNAITVTRDAANTAPSPIDFIVAGNNGVACGVGGTVELIVSSTTGGTIAWYHNGVKTTKNTTKIQATAGEWFAVVENGTCSSLPTNTIKVVENYEGGSIATPVMKINGQFSGSWSLCKGGSMFLEVVNPQSGVNYTWYINNEEIGIGSNIYYLVPSSDEFVIRLRATGTGCAKETLNVQKTSTTVAPAPPFIVANTDGALCGGEVTLTATASSGSFYRWFRNGEEIAGQITNTITVNQTGNYTVSAISTGACASIISGAKEITASDFATLSWISHPTTVNVGETKTYSVLMDFPQKASYVWSITPAGAATITNGQGTSSVTIKFNTVNNNVKVSCNASNACGEIPVLTETVKVGTLCTAAEITGKFGPDTVKTNMQATLSITAKGSGLTYQWYKAGVIISGATSSSYTFTAPSTPQTLTYYCVVKAAAPCETPAQSPTFTIAVNTDPETILTGAGSFTGKSCFDIAQGNDNSNSCAAVDSRKGQKTVFSNRTPQDPAINNAAPYTGVQVYTFTPTGTVSKVRFDFVDQTGQVIQSITPNSTSYANGLNISTPCKVTVNFNPNLDNSLKGLTRQTGLKATLYAVYNSAANGGGEERMVKINLSLQDCACCGAKTTSGGWLTFMCHNLGADESLDPFTSVKGNADGSGGTWGSTYQWGRGTDGHQKRNSATVVKIAKNITATNPVGIQDKFVSIGGSAQSWLAYPNDNNVPVEQLWGNGTRTDVNPPKGINDPCPPGWKVPSMAQWRSIFNDTPTPIDFFHGHADLGASPNTATANTWKWTYTGGGYKVGDALFLPSAGIRVYTGEFNQYEGSTGAYWSSSQDWYIWGKFDLPLLIMFDMEKIYTSTYHSGTTGASVRCVAE